MKSNVKESRDQLVRALSSLKLWKYEYARDLKSWSGGEYKRGVCEKCGRKDLRYLHTLSHRYVKKKMVVGCRCASKMISDSDAPFWHERRLISRPERRKKWLNLLWKRNRNGNYYLKKNKHFITVFRDKQDSEKYRVCISQQDEEPFFGPCSYDTLKDAKMAAFDLLEEKFNRGPIKPRYPV